MRAALLLGVAAMLPIAKKLLWKTAFLPGARALQTIAARRNITTLWTKEVRHSCCDTMWDLTLHLLLVMVMLWTVKRQPWLWSYRADFGLWPLANNPYEVQCFYQVALGYAVGITYDLALQKVKCGSDWMLLVHHVIQIVLLAGAYHGNFPSVGFVILSTHQPDHILRDVSILLRFGNLLEAGDVAYGMFIMTWCMLRLVVFPMVAFRCNTFCWHVVNSDTTILSTLEYMELCILPICLIALLVVHVYFSLFLFSSVKRHYV